MSNLHPLTPLPLMLYNIIMVYLRTLGLTQNNNSLAENYGKQAGAIARVKSNIRGFRTSLFSTVVKR